MGEVVSVSLLLLDSMIIGLVADLGHPRYQKREEAAAAIRTLAPMAVPKLEEARRHPDPEIAHRADRLLAEYYSARADYLAPRLRPTDYPCLPWLDMLPSDYPAREVIIRTYLEQVRNDAPGDSTAGWSNYRRATLFFVRDQLSSGRSPTEVVQVLDQMVTQEKSWIDRNKHNPNLALTAPAAASK